MRCDFDIEGGITLVQGTHHLDLHNVFNFCGLEYSIENRTLSLRWRPDARHASEGLPTAVTIEFQEVSEFRFMPRDPELPFTEDDCLHAFGFWTDEAWARGDVVVTEPEKADPRWLSAIEFMSGAIVAVQAASAHAHVEL